MIYMLNSDHVRSFAISSDQNLLMRVLQTRQQFTNTWRRFEQQTPFWTARGHAEDMCWL